MLIHNMGLFWQRDSVFWGAKKNPGKLLGVLATQKRGDPTNFWEQVGVYALYANFRLVYVGQAGGRMFSLGNRLRQHRQDDLAGRWDRFSWFGLRFVRNDGTLAKPASVKLGKHKELLNVLEGICIELAEPPLNSQGGRLRGVERYTQRRDERVPDTLHQLQASIEKLGREFSERFPYRMVRK